MNNITFKLLPQFTGGELVRVHSDSEIHDLITDSRKANPTGFSIFFAINGVHSDGHRFIKDVYELGCRQFVVERVIDFTDFKEANFLLVNSSVHALQRLSAYKRSSFNHPVIGITGSNGKTIVKEWLSQLLMNDFNVIKNPGSYNSQLGVPLSVWQLDAQHNLGIFEAGISKLGEMEKLEKVIKPDIGVLTNILSAHDEGFESKDQKANEKIKLFTNSKIVIYCKDHELIDRIIQEVKPNTQKILTWGVSQEADIRISRLTPNTFQVRHQDKSIEITKEFTDGASWENLFHCLRCASLKYAGTVITARCTGSWRNLSASALSFFRISAEICSGE
jgi:alanine racemase